MRKATSYRDKKQLGATLVAKKIIGYQGILHLNIDMGSDSIKCKLISCMDDIIRDIKPTTIYCPWYGDLHQDHRLISDACSSATRISNNFCIPRVFMYEVPSSTDQGFYKFASPFVPNYYIELSKRQVEVKCSAMHVYTTEAAPLRSESAIIDLARKRGRECNKKYAEAFVCVRYIDE